MKYISAIEAAERRNLSSCRIITLCNEGRIVGAQKIGTYWLIPETTEKSTDARIKSDKYINSKWIKFMEDPI